MVINDLKGQLKIQQMAFMIIAVFIFFVLVGLVFLVWQFGGTKGSFEDLQKEQAISSLSVISDMPELSFDERKSFQLDEDKLIVMSSFSEDYKDIWPVASVKAYTLDPFSSYVIYDSGQTRVREYSTYVSICKRVKEFGSVYTKCEVGKLSVGVKLPEE
jgi:hypothetical protein